MHVLYIQHWDDFFCFGASCIIASVSQILCEPMISLTSLFVHFVTELVKHQLPLNWLRLSLEHQHWQVNCKIAWSVLYLTMTILRYIGWFLLKLLVQHFCCIRLFIIIIVSRWNLPWGFLGWPDISGIVFWCWGGACISNSNDLSWYFYFQ